MFNRSPAGVSIWEHGKKRFAKKIASGKRLIFIIVYIIIWFGDTVTVLHFTKCDKNSNVLLHY